MLNPKEIGFRIKQRREELGLTLEDIASYVKVARSTIQRYEAGSISRPKLPVLYSISQALRVSPDWLLGITDDPIPSKSLNAESNAAFDRTLTSDAPVAPSKKAPSISDEAMRMARDYDKLDNWGRQAVRDLADTELARMEDEARFMNSAALEDEPKIINLYAEPAAAGIAVPTMGVDFEPYTLKPDDPHGAAFAVRLQGDSMEPYFPDGSIVFVNHDAMVNGDIGIFCVDSGTVCKQYYRDPLGMVYLFSLNRNRSDADVILGPSSNRTLICQGRVITKRRFPIPV